MLNKAINGERFQIYVEEVLAPTLSPGDIVIMDNLGAHKAKAVRAAIQDAGASSPSMKYSPDLNPIEQLFARIKHHLRKAQAPIPRYRLQDHRPNPRRRHTTRMLKLSRSCRI